jgi:glucokinase
VERVCSGIGVPNIYEFLRDQEKIPERPEIAQSIASAKNHTKAIVEAAVDPQHPSELCLAMVDLLVSILANEAGNLALKVLATGGVYLAGGIALHLVKLTATTAIRADLHQKRTLQRFNGTDAD